MTKPLSRLAILLALVIGLWTPRPTMAPQWTRLWLPSLFVSPMQAAVSVPKMYSLSLQTQLYNPLDSTTYYFGGSNNAATTTEGNSRIVMQHNGRIVAGGITVTVWITLGTSETATLQLRKNATTDTQVHAAVKHDAVAATFTFSGLPVSFVTGDRFEFKSLTPAFATNPTQVTYSDMLVIEADSR